MTAAELSIQLAVTNLAATEAFYGGILELPVRRELTSPGAPGHLILERNGWNIIFVEEDAVLRSHPMLAEEFGENQRGTGLSFHFRVADSEEAYAAVLEEELEVVYPLRTHPYGVREFWCRDPDGYLVVVTEPLLRTA